MYTRIRVYAFYLVIFYSRYFILVAYAGRYGITEIATSGLGTCNLYAGFE